MRARTRFLIMAGLIGTAILVQLFARDDTAGDACAAADAETRPVPAFSVAVTGALPPDATVIASFFGPGTAVEGEYTDGAGNLLLGGAQARVVDGVAWFDAVRLCAARLDRLDVPGAYRVLVRPGGAGLSGDLPDLDIAEVAGRQVDLRVAPEN